jgi:pimeloyl-ACP methyl ester carboxylesterase
MKRAYADIPEGQIHYRIEGSGDPVLLLHAATTSSLEYAKVIQFMSKSYCAIAMDFLGNGDSDQPPYQYQVEDHARTVVSFMDYLGIKKANVVGHHVGGKVALELAVTWPQRVNKLVLSSVGYKPEAGESIVVNDPVKDLNFTGRVDIKPDGSHLIEWWRRASLWGHPLDVVEERALEYHKAGPRGEEIHWAGAAYKPKTKAKLPLINCPTLVLSTTNDPWRVFAEAEKRLIPNSKVTIIENGPIDVNRLMPKEFAEAILNFLQ